MSYRCHWAGSPSRCLAQAKDDGGRPSQGGAPGSGQDRPEGLSASPTTHDPIAKREGCCSAQWLSCELFKRLATDSGLGIARVNYHPGVCARRQCCSAQCDVERARVLLRSVDRNERRAKEHSRQIVDLVLVLDPYLRRVDVNGDQMATWTYRRSTFVTDETSALASKPILLFRKNGPVVFTKKYVKHTLFSKKEYPQGPRA